MGVVLLFSVGLVASLAAYFHHPFRGSEHPTLLGFFFLNRRELLPIAVGLVTLIGLILLAAFLFAPGAPYEITVDGSGILTVPPALGI